MRAPHNSGVVGVFSGPALLLYAPTVPRINGNAATPPHDRELPCFRPSPSLDLKYGKEHQAHRRVERTSRQELRDPLAWYIFARASASARSKRLTRLASGGRIALLPGGASPGMHETVWSAGLVHLHLCDVHTCRDLRDMFNKRYNALNPGAAS